MIKVEEYRVLPQAYTKKSKSGIQNLRPKHLVRVSNMVKENENWLNIEGEALGYPVYRGIEKF